MGYLGHGGFAERAIAPADVLHPIPDGMSFEEAAAFPIVYGTAYSAVVQRGDVKPGETAIVTAAAGGVGLAAVQIAKAVGARVIGLASGDKLDVVRAAGADVAIDYRAGSWVEEVLHATDGRGADVIVENVGGDVFDGCTKCIAWGGRLAVVGFASGRIPEIKLNRVLLKHVSLVGVHWGPMHRHELHTVQSRIPRARVAFTDRRRSLRSYRRRTRWTRSPKRSYRLAVGKLRREKSCFCSVKNLASPFLCRNPAPSPRSPAGLRGAPRAPGREIHGRKAPWSIPKG